MLLCYKESAPEHRFIENTKVMESMVYNSPIDRLALMRHQGRYRS